MNIIITFLAVLGSIFLLFIVLMVSIYAALMFWINRNLRKAGLQDLKSVLKDTSALTPEFINYIMMIPFAKGDVKAKMAILKDGLAYCDSDLPIVLADWDPQVLQARATARILDDSQQGNVTQQFNSHRQHLGRLNQYKGVRTAQVRGENIYFYLIEATFEKGLALLKIELSQEQEQWLINTFEVEYLFPDPPVIDVESTGKSSQDN